MIETAIINIVKACCRLPALALIIFLILTLSASLFTYENFAIDTDTGRLISSRLPWRQRELQLDAAFPQQVDTLLVVVDGATPELADGAAKILAAALAKESGHIKAADEVEAGPFFENNGLLFLSVEQVRQTTEQLIRAQPFLGTLAADPTLRGLAHALAFIPRGVKAGAIESKDFAKPLSILSATVDALLAGRPAAFSWNELMTGEAPAPRELRRFIRVKPILNFDALQPGAAASETIRKTAAALGLTPDKGLSVRLTGPIAMADEEFGTVADGATVCPNNGGTFQLDGERVRVKAGDSPVLLKIAPDLSLAELDDVVHIARSRRVDGMIVANTTLARPSTLREQAGAREQGGLSGRPLFRLSTRMVAETYVRAEGAFPLVGVGGIDTGGAALTKIRAGASLIQLYSSLIYRGLGLVDDIKNDLASTLLRTGRDSLSEIVGADAATITAENWPV